MGLFDFLKKPKIDYSTYSLTQLAELVDDRIALLKEKRSSDIVGAYIDKLLFLPESEGGFGLNPKTDTMIAHIIISYGVYQLGAYKSLGKYSGGTVKNYWIEYARLFYKADIHCDDIIFSGAFNCIKDLIKNDDLDIECLGDSESWLFLPLLYEGDKETVIYKIKACDLLFESDGLEQYGVFKKDANGNPTDEYITPEDILSIDNEKDIKDYLHYHQTR